jgi:hypothetical protein
VIRAGPEYLRRVHAKLVLAVVAMVLFAPASARAGEVRLWACHGPDGGALPASFETYRSAGR